jgi:hypothetical protein
MNIWCTLGLHRCNADSCNCVKCGTAVHRYKLWEEKWGKCLKCGKSRDTETHSTNNIEARAELERRHDSATLSVILPGQPEHKECPDCMARGSLENYKTLGQVPFNYWWVCGKCGLVFSDKTLKPVPVLGLFLARWGVAFVIGLAVLFYAWLFRQ